MNLFAMPVRDEDRATFAVDDNVSVVRLFIAPVSLLPPRESLQNCQVWQPEQWIVNFPR